MNKWFAGCDNVKLFELHKNDMGYKKVQGIKHIKQI